jgi:hypothetical protein
MLAPVLVLSLVLRRPGRFRTALAVIFPFCMALFLISSVALDWGTAFRPVTPAVVFFTPFAAVDWWRKRSDPEAGRASLQLAFSTLALTLLLKVFLKPVLWGYAFALALPAMLVVVLALLHSIPARIDRSGGYSWMFRGVSLALLVVAGVGCLRFAEPARISKTVTIGEGGDRFRADRRLPASGMVANLVGWVDANVPHDASLVVLPEGVIVNYLTRRATSTPHMNFVPPEVVIFGEDWILRDLQAQPPDYVILVHRETVEYGLPLFGIDYATSLMEWAQQNYEVVARAGAVPLNPQRLSDGRRGFEIRRRRGLSR